MKTIVSIFFDHLNRQEDGTVAINLYVEHKQETKLYPLGIYVNDREFSIIMHDGKKTQEQKGLSKKMRSVQAEAEMIVEQLPDFSFSRFEAAFQKKSIKKLDLILSPDDLVKITALSLYKIHLQNARDWLLIHCELGRQISTVMTFNREMIETPRRVSVIRLPSTSTTMARVSVEITDAVFHVLVKREGDFPPPMALSKYNNSLKEICKQAGLTYLVKVIEAGTNKIKVLSKYKLVSSYIGRKTWDANNLNITPSENAIRMAEQRERIGR